MIKLTDAEANRLVHNLYGLVQEAHAVADRLRAHDVVLEAALASGARLRTLHALRTKALLMRELLSAEAAVRAAAAAAHDGGQIAGYSVSGVEWLNPSGPASA
jgi:hypothetical protein